MIDYAAVFSYVSGAFPNIVGVNSTGPSTADGTEFIKAFIDDIWGRFQAMLDYANLTPSGVTESPAASQHIDAIKKGFGVGPGMGVIWWKQDDPSVTGDRVLLLNGQGILRANYADLDAEVYVGDANNAAVAASGGAFFRADNSDGSSPNIAGIYLIMPDTRGYALRGLDAAAAVDPDGASRYVGDAQLDAMQRITGDFTDFNSATGGVNPLRAGNNTLSGVFVEGAAGNDFPSVTRTAGGAALSFDSANSTSPNAAKTDDTETRMSNISTKYGITY